MKTVAVVTLEAGMRFSEPVYLDDTNLLVPANVEIRQKDIDRLEKWNIEVVLTDGSQVMGERQDDADAVLPLLDEVEEAEQPHLYVRSVTRTNRMFSDVGVRGQVAVSEIDELCDALIAATANASDEMLSFVLQVERSDPSIGLSAVNTVILSLLVGQTLQMDAAALKRLSTAALLHDIGMMRVPQDIVHKKANLSAEEIKTMRTHTLHSYQIITKELGLPEAVGLIAIQHHERWDGQGYPRRIAGKNIPVEARIIMVADAFEAMVKDRPYRNSMIAYAAMRQLLNDNSRHFDSEILKVFIKSVGIYPIGTYIILNNGSIGRVIKVNDGAPLRPCVQLLVDRTGRRMAGDEDAALDLTEEKEIFIARAIDPKALAAQKGQ